MADELRLWAISIQMVRQCFAAPPALAETLRQITDSALAVNPIHAEHGLLSKLGPLTRHPVTSLANRPDLPTRQDAETMLSGHFITPDRRMACWALIKAWLDSLAPAHTIIELSPSALDAVEFDLARAEVPTYLSIRHLWRLSLDIPISVAGLSIGYMDHPRVVSLVNQWTAATPELEPATTVVTGALLDFAAVFSAPDPLDLVAWWTGH